MTTDKVSRFIARIAEGSKRDGKGKVAIDSQVVRKIVADQPETAAMVVHAYCELAKTKPSYFQLALAVAAAYQVEFDDDSLMLQVEQAMRAPGAKPMPALQFADARGVPLDPKQAPLRQLDVMPTDLASGDVSNFLRVFSVDGLARTERIKLHKLWGTVAITFPTEDSRPVTQIPTVRRFVRNLHTSMPYFPCYLNMHPKLGMFFTYFGCLSEEPALSPDGLSLNLSHPDLARRILDCVHAISVIAREIDVDATATGRAILAGYAEDVASRLLQAALQP